jgi:hypothetical protein
MSAEKKPLAGLTGTELDGIHASWSVGTINDNFY